MSTNFQFSYDPQFWDDTELIKAWDESVRLAKQGSHHESIDLEPMRKKARQDKISDLNENENLDNLEISEQNDAYFDMTRDPSLNSLIMTWYKAGYQTGYIAAQRDLELKLQNESRAGGIQENQSHDLEAESYEEKSEDNLQENLEDAQEQKENELLETQGSEIPIDEIQDD
ncbi:hypothetical protein O9G_005650 [Rozella allomycis CSF55]|uniref:Survival Motor Neuron Gemin2-binding domain-containing protein n=1 Tax=Rozella allomycis (strain CSF55) TaxID=988480 RepID=A0A075B233_ROZAC|nr:hypothetical protein O9G_005650 [Rozella allomycis CSF55]|eukprot:EPZ36610.1 hypothetical protein O9G_005650 [Rozella allomycis CSF55]